MIGTFDTETVGLFGGIRLIGWYSPTTGYQVTSDARAWYDEAQGQGIVWYAHNLDFDIAKLWTAVPEMRDHIVWSKSIFINFRATKIVLDNGIELRDSMAILPGSLDSVLTSWGVATQKLDAKAYAEANGYVDLDDFFTRVPLHDTFYREYLQHDVIGLYEVLIKLQAFTELAEDQFLKCITTAGMAVKLFRTWYPEQCGALCRPRWRADSDEKLRAAYYGGRTEVFKTNVQDGYHYDVNSLYPYVMGAYSYPYGYPDESTDDDSALRMWEKYLPDTYGQRWYTDCIVTARVHVPEDQNIPPLPTRINGRLVFPVGTFEGTWCGCELEEAIKLTGTKVMHVKEVLAWTRSVPYFDEWVDKMSVKKREAKGAEREFYKLLQNSLYGKFGQRREQINVSEWSTELIAKLDDKGNEYQVRETDVGLLVDHVVTRFSDHMQPHIAAHITAHARIEWLRCALDEQKRGNVIVYGDTDSLVTTRQMDKSRVHESIYGRWKLEREVSLGLFISPKLYGEIDSEGAEHLKGKGLLKSYRESMSYSTYEAIAKRLASGESVLELYRGVLNRKRFVRCVLAHEDVDTKRIESKSVHGGTWQKRCIDWSLGTTRPWVASIAEVLLMGDSGVYLE